MNQRATAWGAYKAISDVLRRRITDREFAPGVLMPSEAALCAEFGVARNTLRRALHQLVDEGLISVEPGRGRRVASPGDPRTPAVPQYRRIADDIRVQVESGDLQPGDALPSESALMTRYAVSRGTARQALTDLAGAGLIEVIHGKGRFVRQ